VRDHAIRTVSGLALLSVAAALAYASAGCGASRWNTPYTRELVASDPQVALGERVFAAHCHQCHPGGAGGLGPSINDKPLPVALIKTQVRKGLGAMPAFQDDEITDEQVDAIAVYLKALRSLDAVASR
jgi:mono/diheme cytochrome c family protein